MALYLQRPKKIKPLPLEAPKGRKYKPIRQILGPAHHRSGKKPFYGQVVETSAGRKVGVLFRHTNREIFWSGQKPGESMASGTACWTVERATLLELRKDGIEFLVIIVMETGDKYMTKLENFFDPSMTRRYSHVMRGESQVFLPLDAFTKRMGSLDPFTRSVAKML